MKSKLYLSKIKKLLPTVPVQNNQNPNALLKLAHLPLIPLSFSDQNLANEINDICEQITDFNAINGSEIIPLIETFLVSVVNKV